MNKRRIISLLLLAVYIIASGANSLGVLWCDCSAHHSHDLCCGSHEHGHSHDGCRNDHLQCASFCETEGYSQMLTQHCSCTHRHGESSLFTLSYDTDELLKYLKLFVADALYSFDVHIDSYTIGTVAEYGYSDDIPIVAPPVISTGAPRAPSFLA